MVDITEELKEIVHEIVEAINPSRIYLYGDHAYNSKDTEYSLCILIGASSKKEIGNEIEELLSNKTYKPTNVLIQDRNDFKNSAKVEGTIEHTIVNEGLILMF